MMRQYILDGIHPVLELDMLKFFEWRNGKDGKDHCRIGFETIDDFAISTVFLGLDHGYGAKEPILFETLVTNNGDEVGIFRYFEYNEALLGHKILVEMAKNNCLHPKLNIEKIEIFAETAIHWFPSHEYDVKIDKFQSGDYVNDIDNL